MSTNRQQRNQQKVIEVMALLWENRDRTITLDQCSEWVHFSPAHFHRLYKAVTGETVFVTHQRMRMTQACSELMHQDWPVTRIARRLGFSGPESFVRAFARHTGTTPGKWRLQTSSPLSNQDKDTMMHTVELIDLPKMAGISLSHKGDYMLIGERFGFFAAWAAQHAPDLLPDISWGLYYDDPASTALAELRSEIFCPTKRRDIALAEGMQWKEMPAMRCAVIEHRGAYSEMHKTYQWLYGEWLPASEQQPADHPCLEHYINDPQTTDAKDLITHIHMPLQ